MYIKTRVVSDIVKQEANMTLSFYYNNKQIITGSIYANKELAVYNFPQIYSKPLYVKLSDAYKNMPVKIDVEKYTKLFDIKANKQLQDLVASYAPVLMPQLTAAAKFSDKKVDVALATGKNKAVMKLFSNLIKIQV